MKASDEIHFEGQRREEVCGWMNQTLRLQNYGGLGGTGRGLVRSYLGKMTGVSRAQVTRLITQYLRRDEVKPKAYRRSRFPTLYTRADAELLAGVDEAHETLSGPATQKILQREWYDFGDARYQRLARISVAQLYRVRRSATYRKRRIAFQATRPVQVGIGERRAPRPGGRSGYLRVDTVHQGDLEDVKGVYHINAVDEVTQWQVVGATAQISEAALEQAVDRTDQVATASIQRQCLGRVEERSGGEKAFSRIPNYSGLEVGLVPGWRGYLTPTHPP